MEWKILSKADASRITAKWQMMDSDDFGVLVSKWNTSIDSELDENYKVLRNEIVTAFDDVRKTVKESSIYRPKKDYFTDLFFARREFEILNNHGFGIRMASNDEVWIYLCTVVFPDIIQWRYPSKSVNTEQGTIIRNVNEERFWKTRRRIYLKVLWWYFFLSMQYDENGKEDFNQTVKILTGNSTDEIVQLVERSGISGYRPEVYRKIMKYYSDHRDKYDNGTFRAVMVLNTAKTNVIEPELMHDGVNTYVEEIFKYFEQ